MTGAVSSACRGIVTTFGGRAQTPNHHPHTLQGPVGGGAGLSLLPAAAPSHPRLPTANFSSSNLACCHLPPPPSNLQNPPPTPDRRPIDADDDITSARLHLACQFHLATSKRAPNPPPPAALVASAASTTDPTRSPGTPRPAGSLLREEKINTPRCLDVFTCSLVGNPSPTISNLPACWRQSRRSPRQPGATASHPPPRNSIPRPPPPFSRLTGPPDIGARPSTAPRPSRLLGHRERCCCSQHPPTLK